jgi:archaellum component FlaC
VYDATSADLLQKMSDQLEEISKSLEGVVEKVNDSIKIGEQVTATIEVFVGEIDGIPAEMTGELTMTIE